MVSGDNICNQEVSDYKTRGGFGQSATGISVGSSLKGGGAEVNVGDQSPGKGCPSPLEKFLTI